MKENKILGAIEVNQIGDYKVGSPEKIILELTLERDGFYLDVSLGFQKLFVRIRESNRDQIEEIIGAIGEFSGDNYEVDARGILAKIKKEEWQNPEGLKDSREKVEWGNGFVFE